MSRLSPPSRLAQGTWKVAEVLIRSIKLFIDLLNINEMHLFPFDKVRPEQNKLIEDIKSAVENGKNIIAHAPTGLGKTVAALTPILEYALEKKMTIFYLTSRNTQHTQIIDTLRAINKKQKIIVADFIGKKGMCPHILDFNVPNFIEFCNSNRKKGDCKLILKTLKKIEYTDDADAFIETLIKQGPLNVEEVVAKCFGKFCAYEISMRLAQQADVIVADYYHIFSPKVRKFFLSKIKKDLTQSIVIVDEAHNLPNRVRNLLTNKTNTLSLNRLADEIKKDVFNDADVMLKDIANRLKMFAEQVLQSSDEIQISKKDFVDIVESASGSKYDEVIEAFEEAAEDIEDADNEDSMTRFVGFLKSWLGSEDGFIRILHKEKTKGGKQFISVEYNCLHPGTLSKDLFKQMHSTILMSGTLVPCEMYRDVLGLSEDTLLKIYQNPFPAANRLVLVSSDITTKYSDRTEQMFKKIAVSCAYIINQVKGNSAIFFSSYDVLRKTMFYLHNLAEKELFVEVRGMNKSDREELIANFKKNIMNGGGALLGVQGASFSEGIDLPGDLLKAVAVVGVPLAPPDLTTKAVINYYDKNFKKGWDYGYIFPAMNKALQSAGRCIRSETDRGIIAFLDKRFSWGQYATIIPPDWNPKTTDHFGDKIEGFFDN
jgi:DNA excision repair protein ERCC-2